MQQGNGFVFKNTLLQQLKPLDQSYLRSIMQRRMLVQDQILQDFDASVSDVYFIETGMAAIICRLDGCRDVQVAVIGQEGVVGALTLLDAGGISSNRIFVQMSGDAWHIAAGDFLAACDRIPDLRDICIRCLHADFVQANRSAACNAAHGMEARFARWILTADDCAADGVLSLTHRSLAMMVGAHRTRVTAAARKLQDAGCIKYSRGRLFVRDRNELEARACSCYAANRDIVARVFHEYNMMFSMPQAIHHDRA